MKGSAGPCAASTWAGGGVAQATIEGVSASPARSSRAARGRNEKHLPQIREPSGAVRCCREPVAEATPSKMEIHALRIRCRAPAALRRGLPCIRESALTTASAQPLGGLQAQIGGGFGRGLVERAVPPMASANPLTVRRPSTSACARSVFEIASASWPARRPASRPAPACRPESCGGRRTPSRRRRPESPCSGPPASWRHSLWPRHRVGHSPPPRCA